ncbi:MAG: MG2 domain-containing protein [Flavobacteriaceae bacterium]
MKYLYTGIMLICFAHFSQAQTPDYNSLWNKVEQFEINSLPKSALEIVEDIGKLAEKDKNKPQLIKTMLFKSKFALVLEENAQLKVVTDFKQEIEKAEFPVKNILQNMLANMLWQYSVQNRWKLYNRTETEEKVDADDFRTWDLQTLFGEVHQYYQNSLQNGLMLQLEPLSTFDALLSLQKNSKIYRPTLFDFLNHNALVFYKTNETQITKPAYKFEIDNPDFLSDAKTYTHVNIVSPDSTSLQLHALKIYQNLIQFHLNDQDPRALAEVNMERLDFVTANAIFNNKENVLLNTLKAESEQLKSNAASGLYQYKMALLYYQESKKYQPNTQDEYRWKAKEALDICNAVILEFPESKAAEKCTYLKAQITLPNLNILTENFLPIEQHGRLLVQYSNLDQASFKAYALSRTQLEKFNNIYRQDEQQKFIESLSVSAQWESNLKNENDYQQHSTEIAIPKLKNGSYVIVAATNNNATIFAFNTVQITNIVLVETDYSAYKLFQAIDRSSGKPLGKAEIQLKYTDYGSNRVSYKNYVTNTNGEVKIEKMQDRYRNISVKISHQNDTAYFGDYYINRYYDKDQNTTNYRSFIFTDRSIYRPGQTLHFKAIALTSEVGKSNVLPNAPVTVRLFNVNNEEVAKTELVTNEFGSVAGEFILPSSGLNGNYRIDLSSSKYTLYGNCFVSVEEYKRPKFETKITPITETFKVNDSVTVNGTALAYAGSSITDAKVVYRVRRNVQYPRWYYWYKPWFNSEPQEITHGETTTNDKGEFSITFKALPDQSVHKSSLPVFNYEITTDVTDLNGETRSATSIVNVGYHALTASMAIAEKLDKDKKDHSIAIDTKNLNGEFVPANGTIKIYKLQAPGKVLRPRPWAAADYQNYTETEFKTLFPHDAYSNEYNPENWKKGELLLEKAFNTETDKNLALGNVKNWPSGLYLITLESKDKFGQLVKDEIKTTLYGNNDPQLADNQLFSITTDAPSYSIGETAKITFASAAENLNITVNVEKNHEVVSTQIITLNNNKKTIAVPVEAADLGGFAIKYSFSAFNSFQSGVELIAVPYPKTELDIETKTFRDKLQPNTDETWSFTIKGPKGDKVSAELLASMYDVSLDQFKPHNWAFSPIFIPGYYSYNQSNARQSFGIGNFRVYNLPSAPYYLTQQYDQLNWFGFDINNSSWQYNRYINVLRQKQQHRPNESKYDAAIKDGVVAGTVFDWQGSPLAGANIEIKGTAAGAVADFDGNFTIKANKDNILVFSFVGYVAEEITIGNHNSFKIYLNEDFASLDEVVTVGFARQEKSANVGAAKMVSDEAEVEEAAVPFSQNVDLRVLNENASPEQPNETSPKNEEESKPNFDNIQIRKNLQETAFFFPQLRTNSEGEVSFSFTTPEALTQWKLQLLAHTKTLESATKTLTTVTQKELMVTPNAPRFLRQGDQITISTKITNLSEKALSGQAKLILTDAITGQDITANLLSSFHPGASANLPSPLPSGELEGESFAIPAKGNTQVSWQLTVPDTVGAVQYKIVAQAGNFSDGEQNALPVLSNRMLVTETLPMWIKSNETRTFVLDKLKNNTSTSLKNHQLTLEVTSNPAWYAVQALPYLMEYPYECNEQTFSRYYANALASHIANSNPRIHEVFKQWESEGALLSNLEKNEELKSILIQETPWLRNAQSETEQKKRIALLFNLNKMNSELQSAINKLESNQMRSGAWPWFKGGYENRYITQHIITGFGHLSKLGVNTSVNDKTIKKAVKYLDDQFVKEYNDLKKYDPKVDLNKDHLSYTQLHYLYMRSFFFEIKKSKEVEHVTQYYHTQIQNYWLSRSLYAKGLMALVSQRLGDTATSAKILKSLRENSVTNDELGMYWKENTSSWYWYQAPIETHALLIEAFSEIENDTQTVDNLKIWLLKHKQTNQWKTTKATTEAVYALLLQGSDWLSVTDMVDVVMGGEKIAPSKLENTKVEAGTGYFKTSWNTAEIQPKMAEVSLTKKGNGIAWGALYWQYFEDLDKITSSETPLKLKKKLFLKRNTDKGEQLSEISSKTSLKVGDLVRVRIELRADRSMEFIHMKDMRAAGFEPINVLSQYKWQDGLGYYESTKDASTNFFFDRLPKGIYVFEYDLRVNNSGNMSNGITTIQSMYAPEFSSHSEGIRVVVE